MSNVDVIHAIPSAPAPKAASPLSAHKSSPWFNILAGVVVITGIIYAGYHLASDLSVVRDTHIYPFILLGVALFIALGFEFVNGFHDTANAVATVIYTHSLPPNFAVIWSGTFNFLGVLISSGSPERELFHDPTCCRRHHVCYRWRIHCGATSKRPVARSCPACPRAVWAGLGAATISVVTTELCVCGASRRIQVSRWRASVASNRPSSLTASARRLPWVGFARRNLGAARRSRPSSPSS